MVCLITSKHGRDIETARGINSHNKYIDQPQKTESVKARITQKNLALLTGQADHIGDDSHKLSRRGREYHPKPEQIHIAIFYL